MYLILQDPYITELYAQKSAIPSNSAFRFGEVLWSVSPTQWEVTPAGRRSQPWCPVSGTEQGPGPRKGLASGSCPRSPKL